MSNSAGYRDPAVAPQQRELAAQELAAWRRGAPHGPFDAFRFLMAHARPSSVLDVGCGAGYYSEVLSEILPEVPYVGCDYSEPMVAVAQETYPDADFVRADQRDLSFWGDGNFDMVMNGCALIHLETTAGVEQALAEAARVANRWVLLHRVPVRPNKLPHAFTKKDAYGTVIHETHFNQDWLRNLWSEIGLVVVAHRTWNAGVDPEQWSYLLQKPAGVTA